MSTNNSHLITPRGAEAAQQTICLTGWTFCQPEIIQHFFFQFLSELDVNGINTLTRLNNPCSKVVTALWNRVDLLKVFPLPSLTIIDAEMLGWTLDDEPPMDNRKVVRFLKVLAPLVKYNDGVTLLTMPKSLTLNRIVTIAKDAAIKVVFPVHQTPAGMHSPVVDDLGEIHLGRTERLLVSNNVLCETPGKSRDEHETLLFQIGCKMPTVQQNIFHCVSMCRFFNKCVYGEFAGRTSSKVNGSPLHLVVRLVVGQDDNTQIVVTTPYYNYEDRGAGACINFQ